MPEGVIGDIPTSTFSLVSSPLHPPTHSDKQNIQKTNKNWFNTNEITKKEPKAKRRPDTRHVGDSLVNHHHDNPRILFFHWGKTSDSFCEIANRQYPLRRCERARNRRRKRAARQSRNWKLDHCAEKRKFFRFGKTAFLRRVCERADVACFATVSHSTCLRGRPLMSAHVGFSIRFCPPLNYDIEKIICAPNTRHLTLDALINTSTNRKWNIKSYDLMKKWWIVVPLWWKEGR